MRSKKHTFSVYCSVLTKPYHNNNTVHWLILHWLFRSLFLCFFFKMLNETVERVRETKKDVHKKNVIRGQNVNN